MFTPKNDDKKDDKHAAEQEDIGYTQSFVLASGFEIIEGFDALIGDGNTKRLFAQITADPDRPEVRPADAYLTMLNSMQPGWIVRVLQTFWPDPLPRQKFYDLVLAWPKATNEGTSIMLDGLILAIQQQGIPYTRKTVIEFLLPGTEGLPWWQSLPGTFAAFGVQMEYMKREEIEALAHWLFNPNLSN